MPIKSALFVDFDNIYIGLSKSDPLAAERFASDPARWLAWLERGLPIRSANQMAAPRQRSVLIRRCYPNPDAGFRRFRSFFTSAAFSVTDCPTLTRTGKNSSDIYMVMDILDTLNHKTHFDEFIIFSGDSDFMPVLLRLRAHDRRTTTLAIDFMPPAYKASCDLVISEEEFIEEALGVVQESSSGGMISSRAQVPTNILKEMAARVYQAAADGGEIAGSDLPDILKDFREFRDSSNWLGFGTSQRLAEALASCEPRLQMSRVNPMMYKITLKMPSKDSGPAARQSALAPLKQQNITAVNTAAATPPSAVRPEKPFRAAERPVEFVSGDEKSARGEVGRLRAQIIAMIKDMVASSATPILLARASQYLVSRLGPQVLDTQWAGAGSFKRLLQGAGDIGLEITTQPEPGYIFDPVRHVHPAKDRTSESVQEISSPAENGETENEAGSRVGGLAAQEYLMSEVSEQYVDEGEEEVYTETLPSLEEFIRRVSRVTGAPDLSPQRYAQVFHGMVSELQKIADGEKAYNTYQSSKSVSDWCAEQGSPVSRGDIVMIFKGVIFQDGVRFGKRPGSYTERDLAYVVLSNIKALCRRSRLELSDYDHHLLEEWILGGLEEPGFSEKVNLEAGSVEALQPVQDDE